jgi:hypothetical protein
MLFRSVALGTMTAATTIFLASAPAATALTMQECSAKYKAAQEAGTLKGVKWNDFRKSECGPGASASPAPAAPATTGIGTANAPQPTPKPANATVGAVFPKAVSPKYAHESAGKARMQTCLDQYNDNKSHNANAGLNWIMKGGGYYSECNKRLKGAT